MQRTLLAHHRKSVVMECHKNADSRGSGSHKIGISSTFSQGAVITFYTIS